MPETQIDPSLAEKVREIGEILEGSTRAALCRLGVNANCEPAMIVEEFWAMLALIGGSDLPCYSAPKRCRPVCPSCKLRSRLRVKFRNFNRRWGWAIENHRANIDAVYEPLSA